VANALVAGVTKRAIGVQVLDGVTAEQQFVKLIYDELVELMGGEGSSALVGSDRGVDEKPQVLLMAGLQGAGKTTSAGKLALTIVTDPKTGKPTERGCVLAAADVYRPAAIAQLQTLGAQVGVPVFRCAVFLRSGVDFKDETLRCPEISPRLALVIEFRSLSFIDSAKLTGVLEIL